MLNTNARDRVRGDPYVTSGLFLRAVRERIIGNRWNLIHKTSFFMPVFSISNFRDLYRFNSLHALQNYSSVPVGRSIWISGNFTSKLASYVAEHNACPKECSKLSERLQICQYGYLRKRNLCIRWSFIATVPQVWMNNIRKWVSTDKKDYGKRSHLLLPNRLMCRGQQKICSKSMHYYSAKISYLLNAISVIFPDQLISIEVAIKYVAFKRLLWDLHELTIWMSLVNIIPSIYSYPASLFVTLLLPTHTVVGVRSGTSTFSHKIIYKFFISSRLLQVPPIRPRRIILSILRNEPGYGSPYID